MPPDINADINADTNADMNADKTTRASSRPGEQDPAQDPEQDRGADALIAALIELEHHVAERGWDAPPRLFALVRTDELIAAEPALAAQQGLRGSADGAHPDALTAIEQDQFDPGSDLIGDLAAIMWPPEVLGCALSMESSFLPADAEVDLPDDPAEAGRVVAEHELRQDIRVVIGVTRDGYRHGVGRLVSQPDELLGAPDLVPGLVSVLAHTLTEPEAPDSPTFKSAEPPGTDWQESQQQ